MLHDSQKEELRALLRLIDACAAAEERLRYISNAHKIPSPACLAALRTAITRAKEILPNDEE